MDGGSVLWQEDSGKESDLRIQRNSHVLHSPEWHTLRDCSRADVYSCLYLLISCMALSLLPHLCHDFPVGHCCDRKEIFPVDSLFLQDRAVSQVNSGFFFLHFCYSCAAGSNLQAYYSHPEWTFYQMVELALPNSLEFFKALTCGRHTSSGISKKLLSHLLKR